MTTETTASQPDARAEALVGAYERAGYRRVAPPILQPAEPFLDLSGEDIRKRMYLTADADGRELCLRPDLTIPVSCDYLASQAAGSAQGFCYLGPVYRDRGVLPAEIVQAGIESFGRPGQGRRRRRDAGARPRRHRALRHRRAGNPHGRRRPVRGAGRGARSGAGLEAAAGEGLQPEDFARPRPGRAYAALRRRTSRNTRAFWLLWNAPIRRPRTRWSPICCRSPASTRSAAAPSARSPSASWSRRRSAPPPRCRGETRALIEKFLAIAGDPDEAAAELRALAASAGACASSRRSTCSRAAPDSSPRAASTSAASASRPRSAAASTITPASCSSCTIRRAAPNGPLVAGGRYDELLTRLGAEVADPGGRLCGVDRARRRERRRAMSAPLIIAVPAKGRLQENTEGVLRAAPACSWSSRAARATIAARSPACPASRSLICRPPRSPTRWRRARSISASPARTCCARRSPTWTSAW